MKIIRNDILPLGSRYGAINLFGVLFVKRGMPVTPEVINHERIHSAQMKELLFLPFYIIYVLEWFGWLLRCGMDSFRAYRMISFEREAYDNESNLEYLKKRKPFNQWR